MGACPRRGARDRPVRGSPAPSRGGGLGLVPALSVLRPVLHAGGPCLSPRIRGGFLPAMGLADGLVRPVRGGAVVPCGAGDPAGGVADPRRLPAPSPGGRPWTMVRSNGAESVVGEGSVHPPAP